MTVCRSCNHAFYIGRYLRGVKCGQFQNLNKRLDLNCMALKKTPIFCGWLQQFSKIVGIIKLESLGINIYLNIFTEIAMTHSYTLRANPSHDVPTPTPTTPRYFLLHNGANFFSHFAGIPRFSDMSESQSLRCA